MRKEQTCIHCQVGKKPRFSWFHLHDFTRPCCCSNPIKFNLFTVSLLRNAWFILYIQVTKKVKLELNSIVWTEMKNICSISLVPKFLVDFELDGLRSVVMSLKLSEPISEIAASLWMKWYWGTTAFKWKLLLAPVQRTLFWLRHPLWSVFDPVAYSGKPDQS